jgi:uncharacterized membrane protein
MKSIYRLIRFFRSFSLFAFILVLFYCYISLPGEVAVHYDENSSPDMFINKSQLFYGLAIFVVLLNTAFMLLSNLIPSLPTRRLRLPYPQFWAEHRNSLLRILLNWVHSFIGVTNLFVIFCLVAIVILNTSNNAQITHYGWLLFIGGSILVGWTVYLPLRLSKKIASHEDE